MCGPVRVLAYSVIESFNSGFAVILALRLCQPWHTAQKLTTKMLTMVQSELQPGLMLASGICRGLFPILDHGYWFARQHVCQYYHICRWRTFLRSDKNHVTSVTTRMTYLVLSEATEWYPTNNLFLNVTKTQNLTFSSNFNFP